MGVSAKCTVCDAEFYRTSPDQKMCSNDCKRWHKIETAKAKRGKTA